MGLLLDLANSDIRGRDPYQLVARLVKTNKRPPDPLCCTPADALPLLNEDRRLIGDISSSD